MRFIAAEYTEGAENLFCGICEAPWLACQARRYGRRPVPDDSLPSDLDALWRAAQERLRASVPESTFRLWLEPLEAVAAEGDTLFLTAPESKRAWTERRYSTLIAEALRSAGVGLEQVSFAEPQLLEGSAEQAIEQGTYRPYFMHKTSHYLGMDVHDVGSYHVSGKPRPLSPGVAVS